MRTRILGVALDFYSHDEIILRVRDAIRNGEQITITYANKYVLNFAFSNTGLFTNLTSFTIVYPDGIGAAIAGKFLGAAKKITDRSVATDLLEVLYPFLLNEKIRVFFFGDTTETLQRITGVNPDLVVAGMHDGYHFSDAEVIAEINSSEAQIVLVGLGTPLQERWIAQNKHVLHARVIIAVGEGIRVFAGNKVRGSKMIQAIGLEWLVRLFHDPVRLWKRYLFGIPQFIFRVIKQKISFTNDKNI